jgi:hypothetical protein
MFAHSFIHLNAQVKTPDSVAERLFMPALQMGYINHNSKDISAGLIIQTSLEYRTKHNLLFRLNYDDFSGRLNLKNANNQIYNARIPLSELIGGVGYRFTLKRHNYFLIAQPGLRFYENPVIENLNGNLTIKQVGMIIGTIRYTFGYEYELFDNVFLNSEVFVGHFLKEKDFWDNAQPYYGITVGISARLF